MLDHPKNYEPSYTKEERQLYDNLVIDQKTGGPLPLFLIKRELDLSDPEIAIVAKFFADAEAEGCDDVWFTYDYDRGDNYVTVTGSAPLNIDELEVYNSLMEKVREYEKAKLEYNIDLLKKRQAELSDQLENLIW